MADNIEDFIHDDYMDELAAQRDAEIETDLIAQHHTAINLALAIAKKGSSSTVKVTLLKALSQMKGHEIRVDEDAPSSALNPIISDMLPPSDHDYWGDKVKPKSQLVNMKRMADAGLLEALWSPEGHIIGFRLTAGGMAYLHRHHQAGLADVIDVVRDHRPDETTNRWFRMVMQMPRLAGAENDWRYKSHATLDMPALVRADRRSLVGALRYQGLDADEVGAILTAVIEKNGGECLRHLLADDREALMYDLLGEAGIDNRAVAKDLVEALNVGPFANRIEKMVEYHRTANVSWADDAKTYINEEVCRYTWALVRNHVDFRVNDLRSVRRVTRRQGHEAAPTRPDFPELLAMKGVENLIKNVETMRGALQSPTVRVTPSGGIRVEHPDDR
jgi:hypothetical protein